MAPLRQHKFLASEPSNAQTIVSVPAATSNNYIHLIINFLLELLSCAYNDFEAKYNKQFCYILALSISLSLCI